MVQQMVPDRSMDELSTGDLSTRVAWDALYADLAPRVYNYFRYRLGSDADVEDLTSRTFEKAWRSRTHYRRDIAGFSTWLFKIAQNVGVDYRAARRSHLPLEAALDVAVDLRVGNVNVRHRC